MGTQNGHNAPFLESASLKKRKRIKQIWQEVAYCHFSSIGPLPIHSLHGSSFLKSLPRSIYLYTFAVSPSLGGSRQHKRNNKNNGDFTPFFWQWRGTQPSLDVEELNSGGYVSIEDQNCWHLLPLPKQALKQLFLRISLSLLHVIKTMDWFYFLF